AWPSSFPSFFPLPNHMKTMKEMCSIYSNGKMEGTNNKVKLMKHRGYGYRNIQRFALWVRLETANILS
ncbi:transposase, partial [Bhargavaea massiliensis]